MDDRRQFTVVSLKPETEKAFFDILQEQSQQLAKLEQLCEGFSKAIPGDDPIGHRKYHELVIAREERGLHSCRRSLRNRFSLSCGQEL